MSEDFSKMRSGIYHLPLNAQEPGLFHRLQVKLFLFPQKILRVFEERAYRSPAYFPSSQRRGKKGVVWVSTERDRPVPGLFDRPCQIRPRRDRRR